MALRATRAFWPVLLALAICGWRLGPGDRFSDALEARLVDLRFQMRGAAPAPESVAIIDIDEASAAAIGSGAPMRLAVARAVDRLRAEGARAVAVDLLFIGPTQADDALAAALGAHPNAVIAAASVGDVETRPPLTAETAAALRRSAYAIVRKEPGARAPSVETLISPAPPLVSAALLGHVNLTREKDRFLRRMPVALEVAPGVALPALPVALARLALGLERDEAAVDVGRRLVLGATAIETDAAGRMRIDHVGPGGGVDSVSIQRFLEGASPPGGVAGRAVLIGASAESYGDFFATPFGPDVPGVETLAAAAAQLIEGRAIEDGARAAAASLALTLLGAALARRAATPRSVGVAVAATLALWVSVALIAQFAFENARILIDGTAAFAALIAAGAPAWAVARSRERRDALDAARERARLAPHVSPLLDEAERAAAGAQREASVAFVDMVGSIGRAESLPAREAGALLSDVQGLIAAAARTHGGLVVEILGDGALVAFGLTGEDGAGAARRAVDFALAVTTDAPRSAPQMRAGLSFGPVALVDIGAGARRHVTIAGDTVNVAARLKDLASERGVALLASEALVLKAEGASRLRRLSTEIVRGRTQPLDVFAPL